MSTFAGQVVDPVLAEARAAVEAVLAGVRPESLESQTLDFKEDKSRRGPNGGLVEGRAEHDETAKDLADAASCLANRDGGVIVVGVIDSRTGVDALVGTALDESWLARRVHELTSPNLTLTVLDWHEQASGARLLFLRVPKPPVATAVSGRYKHRVGRDCVGMSAAEVAGRSGDRDWSGEPSSLTVDDIDPEAAETARTLLRRTGVQDRVRIAALDDAGLVRALSGVLADGRLNKAAALMFGVRAADAPAHLDVQIRRVPGAISLERLDAPGRPLIAEVAHAFDLLARHTQRAPHIREAVRVSADRLPEGALREALVNACMHRDWDVPGDLPVTVDLSGDVLVVVSPGAFPPGVTAQNVITSPSRPRNRALAQLTRALRLAEGEGTGVDRMCRELVFRGFGLPDLQETPGPYVRCALAGGDPVREVVSLVSRLPEGAEDDTDLALILNQLLQEPRLDADGLPWLLGQKTRSEANAALRRAGTSAPALSGQPLLVPAEGPVPQSRWWRLSEAARSVARGVLPYPGNGTAEHARWAVVLATQAGQVRAADLRDCLGLTAQQASRALTNAAASADLNVGSEATRGRGVHYLPA